MPKYDDDQRETARKAIVEGHILAEDFVDILANDSSCSKILPILFEKYFPNHGIPFGDSKYVDPTFRHVRVGCWMKIIIRWAGMENDETKYKSPGITYLPYYYRNKRTGKFVVFDLEKQNPEYLGPNDYFKIEDIKDYLKDVKDIYHISIPFPTILQRHITKKEKTDQLSPKKAPFVFRQEGPSWTITYEGKTLRGLKGKGFKFLSYLISHPGKAFTPVELEDAVNGVTSVDTNGHREPGLSHDDQIGSKIRAAKTIGVNDVYDYDKVQKFRERLRQLRKDRQKAESAPDRDPLIIKEIDNEVAQINNYLSDTKRRRQFRCDLDKIKSRVGKNISRAIKEIEKHDQDTGAHFRHALGAIYTTSLSYSPSKRIPWQTE